MRFTNTIEAFGLWKSEALPFYDWFSNCVVSVTSGKVRDSIWKKLNKGMILPENHAICSVILSVKNLHSLFIVDLLSFSFMNADNLISNKWKSLIFFKYLLIFYKIKGRIWKKLI